MEIANPLKETFLLGALNVGLPTFDVYTVQRHRTGRQALQEHCDYSSWDVGQRRLHNNNNNSGRQPSHLRNVPFNPIPHQLRPWLARLVLR